MTTLDAWAEAASGALGVQIDEAGIRAILDLARDVAHQVDRPAAPVTAFLLGLAVGGGQPVEAAAAQVRALAAAWPSADKPD
jgi:hypothetical protein